MVLVLAPKQRGLLQVPQIWTGKGSTLMVRVQSGRVSRGTTNAGNAQSCQQALHCLLRSEGARGRVFRPIKLGELSCFIRVLRHGL